MGEISGLGSYHIHHGRLGYAKVVPWRTEDDARGSFRNAPDPSYLADSKGTIVESTDLRFPVGEKCVCVEPRMPPGPIRGHDGD